MLSREGETEAGATAAEVAQAGGPFPLRLGEAGDGGKRVALMRSRDGERRSRDEGDWEEEELGD